MRLRSRTQFRIVLAIAFTAPVIWIILSSISSGVGAWPWPPGTPRLDTWSIIELKSGSSLATTDQRPVAVPRSIEPPPGSGTDYPWHQPGPAYPNLPWQKYLRNDRTGELIRIDDSALSESAEMDKEGNPQYIKPLVVRMREDEHETAWLARLFIFIVGLFASFLVTLGVGSLILFAARRILGGNRRPHAVARA